MSINLDYAERLADLHIKYDKLKEIALNHPAGRVQNLYEDARSEISNKIVEIQSQHLPRNKT